MCIFINNTSFPMQISFNPLLCYSLSLAPPAYREVVTGSVDFSKQDEKAQVYGPTNFAPTYTYYDWGHTPAGLPEQSGN